MAGGRAAPVVGPIREGARDVTLASMAGTMRARGFGAEAIEAALLVENRRRCDPPLPERDIARIARSIGRYDAPPVVVVGGQSPHARADLRA